MPIDPNIVLQTQQQPSFAQNMQSMANIKDMVSRSNYLNAEQGWRTAEANRLQQQSDVAQQEYQKQQVQQQAMQKLTKSSMRQDGTPDYYKLYQGVASVPGMDLNKITDAQKELQPFIQHQAMDDIRKQAVMPNGYDIDHDKMTKLIASDPRLGPDAAQAFQKQMLSSADDDLKTKLAVQSHAANVFAGAVKPDGTVDPIAYQAARTKFHGILGDNDMPQADSKSIETYKGQYQDPEQALKQRKQVTDEKQQAETVRHNKVSEGISRFEAETGRVNAEKKPTADSKPITPASAEAITGAGFALGNFQKLKELVANGNADIFNTTITGSFTNPTLKNTIDQLTEYHGRKQSGAAISNKEWSKFKDEILNKKFLLTKDGRQAALKNLNDYIGRYYVSGKKVSGDDNWYENYKKDADSGVNQLSSPAPSNNDFDSLWGK